MIELLHVDDGIVVANKPSGLLVHPSELAVDRDTLMGRVRDKLGAWVWPVHRIDRGASGVVVFARDADMARALSGAFASREVEKAYWALVRGFFPETAVIDHPIDGAAAQTRVRRLRTLELPFPTGAHATARYSLVEAEPLTGRLHQIRRHLAHLSHPIVGDVNHGDGRHNRLFRERFRIQRLLLHARSLAFVHPKTGARFAIEADPPRELRGLFDRLGWTDLAREPVAG